MSRRRAAVLASAILGARAILRASAIPLASAILLATSAASAGPSIWAQARRPEIDGRRALLAEAESLQLKYHRLSNPRLRPRLGLDQQEIATLGELYLRRSAQLLEEAGVPASKEPFLQLQLAEAYSSLGQHPRAVALLEAIVRADPPPVLRARAWAQLAVGYAHLGRVEDEIRGYSEALRVQPMAHERARLLANRAEAYMLLGDITAAVEGYRAALALLSSDHLLFAGGATTLWGLAVALDRSGDLDSGLDSVRLARSYDKLDEQINGPGWFYLPDYDRYWYAALGHWMAARNADLGGARAEAYRSAIRAWEEYLGHAARDDKWIPIARVRLKQCEKERDEFLRRDREQRAAEGRRRGKKVEPPSAPLTPEELLQGWHPNP